jgi:hypothetical protein
MLVGPLSFALSNYSDSIRFLAGRYPGAGLGHSPNRSRKENTQ